MSLLLFDLWLLSENLSLGLPKSISATRESNFNYVGGSDFIRFRFQFVHVLFFFLILHFFIFPCFLSLSIFPLFDVFPSSHIFS